MPTLLHDPPIEDPEIGSLIYAQMDVGVVKHGRDLEFVEEISASGNLVVLDDYLDTLYIALRREPSGASFDDLDICLDQEQATALGNALLNWAQDQHEGEDHSPLSAA